MRAARCRFIAALCGLVILLAIPVAISQTPASSTPTAVPAYQRFLSPASPLEVVAAKKADRVAWVTFEEGKRNAYTAAAPRFAPVRLTRFLKDDGIDMSAIQISDDGVTVTVVRGTAPNREGWVANASADPDGPERAIWAVRTTGGEAFRVAELPSGGYSLSPDGRSVLFVKDGQIYRARVTPVRPASEMDRGEKPFIKEWGIQSAPTWSPDGRKIAFVSTRTDHSFIVVYDMATRAVSYMAPSVDLDSNPMWTADSKSIVFVRRPGLSFGQAEQAASRGASGAGGCGGARPGRGDHDRSPDPTVTQPGGPEDPRPDARDLQGRLHLLVLEGRRRDGRSEGGLAQPARRPHVQRRREPAPRG